MKKGMKINWKIFITAFFIVFLTAFIGSIFSYETVKSEWYQSIKPSLTPPNWIFPVVWSILFSMIALSLYFSWTRSNKKQKISVAVLFGINLLLNLLWSFLFFYMKNPVLAFFDLILLWFSIIAVIYLTEKINRISSYLLIPYLIWVTFAGILNSMMILR